MGTTTAGIELVLTAPDVSTIMQQTIKEYEELNKQEKEAADNANLYHEAIKKQLEAMRLAATESKKIKEAVVNFEKEKSDAAELAAVKQNTGIIGTIKNYFAQKAELRNVVIEIKKQTSAILELEERNKSIFKLVHRGNAEAIKEYNANAAKIKELTGSLDGLNTKLKLQEAIVTNSKSKFTGFFNFVKGGFNLMKTTAGLAIGGIAGALGILGASFLVFRRIFNRFLDTDAIDVFTKKNNESFSKSRQAFANALAPIAIGVTEGLTRLADGFTSFIKENQDAVFEWAKNIGGTFFALAKSLPFIFKDIGNLFSKLSADVKFSLQLISVASTGGLSLLSEKGRKDLDDAAKAVEDANKTLQESTDTTKSIFEGSFENFSLQMDKMKAKILSTVDATGKQKDALAELRKEYEKLTAEIAKQIEALSIKEAGPFEGLILKAEIAAKEIEREGVRAVELAVKLQKSNKEILNIRENITRLAQAVRDDAVKTLVDQADGILDVVNKKLEDIRAKQSGTEGSLKLSRDIAAQFKEFETAQKILQAIIDRSTSEIANAQAENRSANEKIVQDGLDAVLKLAEATRKFQQLSTEQTLEFNKETTTKALEETKKNLENNLDIIKKKGEEIKKTFDDLKSRVNVDDETKKDFNLKIHVNEIDAKVAEERIRQFEAAFELFKTTGKFGELETEATIRLKIERQDNAIPTPQPGDTTGGDDNKPKIISELLKHLDEVVGAYEDVYSTITDIVTRSVDAQIEETNRLIEFRQHNLDDLQRKIDVETELKAKGLANNLDLTRKQFDDELKLKEEAEKKAFELAEKRAKLQRQQDSALQISAIITAVANIFKNAATLGPIGIIAGIASATAMLAAFVAFKLQASKIVTAHKGSRHAGKTFGTMAPGEGYDDRPGIDRGLSVVDRHGRLRGFIGGDEVIVKESVSRKHRDFLYYLNTNESKFQNVNLMEAVKSIEPVPSINFSKVSTTIEKHRDRMVVINTKGSGITKKEMEDAIDKAMTKHAKKMMDFHDSIGVLEPQDKRGMERINSKSIKRIM